MRIEFDGEVVGITLRFGERTGHQDESSEQEDGAELLWTREPSLEVLEEVVAFVGERRLPVDTVVLASLGDYPVSEVELARWLVRAARKAGRARMVVETGGWPEKKRARLMALTRREEGLDAGQLPFGNVWKVWEKNWQLIWSRKERRRR